MPDFAKIWRVILTSQSGGNMKLKVIIQAAEKGGYWVQVP